MARPRTPPNYLKHRGPNGTLYARTFLFGVEQSLGAYGSPESHEKLEAIRAQWREAMERGGPDMVPARITIADLVAAFFRHVEEDGLYLRADGTPTSERASFKQSLDPLLRMNGPELAREFSPKKFKKLQAAVLNGSWLTPAEQEGRRKAGKSIRWSRGVTNQRLKRIVRVFGWGVSDELVPVEIHQALLTVDMVPAGSAKAVEHAVLGPVSDQDIRRTLPCMSTICRAIAMVQLATGMRPNEVCSMRKTEVDRRGMVIDGRAIWVYRPGGGDRHKTAHHGVKKAVALGPAAQWALAPWLEGEGLYCFPAGRKARGEGHLRPDSYSHAVLDAARAAGVPDWCPTQLRKAAATAIEDEMDLDHARASLGHTTSATTKRFYAKADLKKAAQAAARLG
ncbi:MAG: site-specific integrase [Gemmataceae bacterium]|nr:site-specific integrase [Gemmataceae bacterium]